MPRSTTAVASAYDRTRVHHSSFVRGETRQFRAEFKALIPKGVTIASATWRCDCPQVVAMSNAKYDTTGTYVTIKIGCGGNACLKAAVTLSDGSIYEMPAVIDADGGIYFTNEAPLVSGPTFLQATAA